MLLTLPSRSCFHAGEQHSGSCPLVLCFPRHLTHYTSVLPPPHSYSFCLPLPLPPSLPPRSPSSSHVSFPLFFVDLPLPFAEWLLNCSFIYSVVCRRLLGSQPTEPLETGFPVWLPSIDSLCTFYWCSCAMGKVVLHLGHLTVTNVCKSQPWCSQISWHWNTGWTSSEISSHPSPNVLSSKCFKFQILILEVWKSVNIPKSLNLSNLGYFVCQACQIS